MSRGILVDPRRSSSTADHGSLSGDFKRERSDLAVISMRRMAKITARRIRDDRGGAIKHVVAL